MKTITLHNTNLSVPEIGMGCMRINSLETADDRKRMDKTQRLHMTSISSIMQISMQKDNAKSFLAKL